MLDSHGVSVGQGGAAATLAVRAPFDLRLTVSALRRLPSSTLYSLVGEEFRFVAPLTGGPRLLAVTSAEGVGLRLRALDGALGAAEQAEARRMLARMLDVERDLAPLWALVADQPELAALAPQLAGMKPPRFVSLWETFCQIVPFQLVSLSAAIATLNRFVEALGPTVAYEGRDYRGLPSPTTVLAAEYATLRACGLSEAKARTLRELAARAQTGALEAADFAGLTDAEAIARLTQIPGIGPWSAQVALLRGLGRLTVFPAGDSGATRGLREVFAERDDPDAAAKELLARMGDWRGYLYFLLLGRRLLASGGFDR